MEAAGPTEPPQKIEKVPESKIEDREILQHAIRARICMFSSGQWDNEKYKHMNVLGDIVAVLGGIVADIWHRL